MSNEDIDKEINKVKKEIIKELNNGNHIMIKKLLNGEIKIQVVKINKIVPVKNTPGVLNR